VSRDTSSVQQGQLGENLSPFLLAGRTEEPGAVVTSCKSKHPLGHMAKILPQQVAEHWSMPERLQEPCLWRYLTGAWARPLALL